MHVISDEASTRQTLVFDDNQAAAALYGDRERTLRILEQELGIAARARGNEVRLIGDEPRVRAGRKVLEELYGVVRRGGTLHPRDVRAAVQMVAGTPDAELHKIHEDVLEGGGGRRRITAKNLSQRRYIELMGSHDVVFSVGPAGTGKTYLAMALALAALQRHEVSRVILTRPAVEAGERLGFLPGTLAEKVNPYLRPLYDALHDMMDYDKAARWIERGVIEVAPLAFMRGRTLNDSFVILDEAQNTTRRADEDVPDATRLRLEGGGDGRHHADRPAPGPAQRPGRGAAHPRGRRGHRLHALHRSRRGAPPAGAVDHPRLREGRRPAAPRGGRDRATANDRAALGPAAAGRAPRAGPPPAAPPRRRACSLRSAARGRSSRSRSPTTPRSPR